MPDQFPSLIEMLLRFAVALLPQLPAESFVPAPTAYFFMAFFVPSFVDVEIGGETKTALRFTVRSRTPVTSLRPRTRKGGASAEEWQNI